MQIAVTLGTFSALSLGDCAKCDIVFVKWVCLTVGV